MIENRQRAWLFSSLMSTTGKNISLQERAPDLCGMSRPTMIHADSQARPSAPFSKRSEPGPRAAATAGSASMAAAEPRYMPEVVSDTARARSCGGTHCSSTGMTNPQAQDYSILLDISDEIAAEHVLGGSCLWTHQYTVDAMPPG